MTDTLITARCYGAEDEHGNPTCDGPDVRDVSFRHIDKPEEWQTTRWCADCRALARASGEHTDVVTWTDLVGECSRGCRRTFRVSQEAIEVAREGASDDRTDREIAESFDFCIGCIGGESPAGEYDLPTPKAPVDDFDGYWQIAGLTVRDIFAINAALEVACDDEEEPFPGLNDAWAKVKPIVEAVRERGHKPHTETSAQSQAYIDGAGPWFKADDEGDDNTNPYGSDQSCTVDEDDD